MGNREIQKYEIENRKIRRCAKIHIVGAAIGRPLPQRDTHKRTSDARPYEMSVIIVGTGVLDGPSNNPVGAIHESPASVIVYRRALAVSRCFL